jgi:hypothetical protein
VKEKKKRKRGKFVAIIGARLELGKSWKHWLVQPQANEKCLYLKFITKCKTNRTSVIKLKPIFTFLKASIRSATNIFNHQ